MTCPRFAAVAFGATVLALTSCQVFRNAKDRASKGFDLGASKLGLSSSEVDVSFEFIRKPNAKDTDPTPEAWVIDLFAWDKLDWSDLVFEANRCLTEGGSLLDDPVVALTKPLEKHKAAKWKGYTAQKKVPLNTLRLIFLENGQFHIEVVDAPKLRSRRFTVQL